MRIMQGRWPRQILPYRGCHMGLGQVIEPCDESPFQAPGEDSRRDPAFQTERRRAVSLRRGAIEK